MVGSVFPMTASGAVVRRGGQRLLGPIDLRLDGSGVTVIIGPNGSGKTTLLRLLHGLERCREGCVDWAVDRDSALSRQAFVFQTPIMMRRTVRENLVYPLRLRGASRADIAEKGDAWLKRVDLAAAALQRASTLSAGERQKLSIARALIAAPELLILDEPSANLDSRSTREIERILTGQNKAGTRIIMATHDMGQARRLGDHVIFMLNGLVHEEGPAERFFKGAQTDAGRAFLAGDIVE